MKLIKSPSFKAIIIIISVVTSGCIEENTERVDVPEWFRNIPEFPNAYVAVGSGDGRAEALCNALSDLSFQIKSKLSAMTRKAGTPKISKSDSGIYLGKVSIESVLKDFYLDNGSEEHTSLVSTVTFDNDGKTFKVSAFYEETKKNGKRTLRTHFEIISENSDIQDVMNELKRSYIDIETYVGTEAYYVKLVVDKDKLKSNIP